MKKNNNRLIIGACGEYYVAAYLSGFEFVVALPRGGTACVDLFVASYDCTPLSIQVKTGTEVFRKSKGWYIWRMDRTKTMKRRKKYLWYAFVWLNGWPTNCGSLPRVFFVPSVVVAKCLEEQGEDDNFPTFLVAG